MSKVIVINRKTAAMWAMACGAGVAFGGGSAIKRRHAREVGEGIALAQFRTFTLHYTTPMQFDSVNGFMNGMGNAIAAAVMDYDKIAMLGGTPDQRSKLADIKKAMREQLAGTLRAYGEAA